MDLYDFMEIDRKFRERRGEKREKRRGEERRGEERRGDLILEVFKNHLDVALRVIA